MTSSAEDNSVILRAGDNKQLLDGAESNIIFILSSWYDIGRGEAETNIISTRQNKYNVGWGNVQITVLLYPSSAPLTARLI